MSKLKIYGIPASRAFRCLWMAHELGLDFELVPIDLLLQLAEDRAAARIGAGAVADEAEGLDRLVVHEDVDLDELVRTEADDLVVHRAVAAGDRLLLVVEVVDDLGERQLVVEDLARFGDEPLALEDSAAAVAQLHQVADVHVRADDLELADRLADRRDRRGIRQLGGVVDLQ